MRKRGNYWIWSVSMNSWSCVVLPSCLNELPLGHLVFPPCKHPVFQWGNFYTSFYCKLLSLFTVQRGRQKKMEFFSVIVLVILNFFQAQKMCFWLLHVSYFLSGEPLFSSPQDLCHRIPSTFFLPKTSQVIMTKRTSARIYIYIYKIYNI